jgi:CBS domain-containing protein
MARTARDIMQKDLVTVSPELPLLDAHQLFVGEEIHGAPVVAEDGDVVGVVSSADLLRAVAEQHDSGGPDPEYLREVLEFSSPDWVGMPEDFQDRLRDVRVSDVMTKELVRVSPDASLVEVARALCAHRIHRVLVTEGGRLAGIISTFDVVSLLTEDEGLARQAS